MTNHERAIAAARASALAAKALELPPDHPDRGLLHDVLSAYSRLEGLHEEESKQAASLRAVVRKLLRVVKVLVPVFIVLVVASIVVGIVAFDAMQTQADRTAAVAKVNHRLALENRRAQAQAARLARKTAVQARVVIREGCEEQNRDRRKLRTIIQRGEATIPKYVAEGTLTPEQGARALAESRQARRDLRDGNCPKRARRIPIPNTAP